MSFALIYLATLLVPGFLIIRLLNIRTQLVLYSVSFSLFYFILSLCSAFFLKLDTNTFILAYCGGILLLVIANLTTNRRILFSIEKSLTGYLVVIICVSIYLSAVGFYNEVPSDVYKHLEFFKDTSIQIASGEFKGISGLATFSKAAQYWYHFPILIADSIGQKFLFNLEIYAAINVIVLLVCVYGFAYWLFKPDISSNLELMTVSLVSVFFFVAHFGINIFSYIRYYAIAPTILNYAVYLTSIICLFGYFRDQIDLFKFLFISATLFFTAYLLHAQEAMFIGTMYTIITFIIVFRHAVLRFQPAKNANTIPLPGSLIPFSVVAGLTVLSFYFYVVNSLPLTRIIPPKVIPVADLIGIGQQYFVLNPFYQFYTVVTHWGLCIIVLYVMYYRRFFSQQPFLLAAMLVPVITVFNPLFTDFFLRLASWDVLWRFLYLLPLFLIAARLVTGLLFSFQATILKRLFNYLMVILILIFLLPLKFSSINFPYSRIYSLTSIHYQARPSYWQDMLDFLAQLPNRESIITDPVTGYMVSALTEHENKRYKFYLRRIEDQYVFEDYSQHPLQIYSGNLLIINRRKGISTSTAKVSGHWHPDTLKLTEYYPDNLIEHVSDYPQHFQILWQTDNIKIYRVIY